MQERYYEHAFLLRHHWWIDPGLVGLFYLAHNVKVEKLEYKSIMCIANANGITFRTQSQETLKDFLNCCYIELAEKHWNVSTNKQRELTELVIYYKDKDELNLIPKRKPTPIPGLFTKGSSFRADADEYGKLPPDLQKRVDLYLEEHRKSLWGNKKKLIYEPPVCHPQIELFPTKGRKDTCCICGQHSVCSDVTQTSFLLFASSTATLSFNSEGKKPDKICWECEFLSKFAVEAAHYKSSDDNLFILQIAAGDARKLIDINKIIGSQSVVRQVDQENYYSNIGTQKDDNRLLYYARMPYELLWAFFHDTQHLLHREATEREMTLDAVPMSILGPLLESSLKLVLLEISSKGQTFLLKEIIAYTELAYIYHFLNQVRELCTEDHKFLFKVFQDLYLPGEGKKYDVSSHIWRNRILQRVLQKKPILQEIERLAHRKCLKQECPYLGNMLEFAWVYQIISQEGKGMTKEQIKIAVDLGKQIVVSAKEAAKGGTDSNFDRVKGDLFALRKTRTVTAFLEQLNRIQFRYNILFSNQILGGVLEEVPFEDFKSYCLLGALNMYNSLKRPRNEKQAES